MSENAKILWLLYVTIISEIIRVHMVLLLSARLKREISGVAAAFLVVESVDAHISLLDFFCAVVERIQALALCRHDKNHIGSKNLSVPLDRPLGSDLENFGHFSSLRNLHKHLLQMSREPLYH